MPFVRGVAAPAIEGVVEGEARVELRRDEEKRASANQRGPGEFREEDFPELAQG